MINTFFPNFKQILQDIYFHKFNGLSDCTRGKLCQILKKIDSSGYQGKQRYNKFLVTIASNKKVQLETSRGMLSFAMQHIEKSKRCLLLLIKMIR
jgi:hypothetical protein